MSKLEELKKSVKNAWDDVHAAERAKDRAYDRAMDAYTALEDYKRRHSL